MKEREERGKKKKRKKGMYIVLAAVLAVAVFCIGKFGIPYLQRHYHIVSIREAEAVSGEKISFGTGDILTVYFTRVGNTDFDDDVDAVASASLMEDNGRLIGNSELLAKMVQNSVGGDLFAITTKKRYSSSYNDTVQESAEENRQEEPLELNGKLPDISQYDMVFLVYPVWWGTIPKAVRSFAAQMDFGEKSIYVIATHGGSGIANSASDFEKESGAKVNENILSVYDKDAAKAREQVTKWLKGLSR